MNKRYRTEVFTALLSNSNRSRTYKRVLEAVTRAQEKEGLVPTGTTAVLEAARYPSVYDWKAQEALVLHETAAWVDCQRALVPEQFRPYLYTGLTSSDLSDTADALLWADCEHDLVELARVLSRALVEKMPPTRLGRTHGRRAAPVPGNKLYNRASRDLSKLDTTYHHATLSGPVGEYNDLVTQRVENLALTELELLPDPYATQTTSRVYSSQDAWWLYRLVAVCEQLAVNHRLFAQSGVDLFQESFGEQQKGSSSLPHKRNPVRSERVCGLARVARGYLGALLETNSQQWLERDLTNSSVDRLAFWDLVQLTAFVLKETTEVVQQGVWFEQQAEAELATFEDTGAQLRADAAQGKDSYYELRGSSCE